MDTVYVIESKDSYDGEHRYVWAKAFSRREDAEKEILRLYPDAKPTWYGFVCYEDATDTEWRVYIHELPLE